MRTSSKQPFTLEEIREMERADRQISRSFFRTREDLELSAELDAEAKDLMKTPEQRNALKWNRTKVERHREKIRAYKRSYYLEHRDEVLGKCAEYYRDHIEDARETRRAYYKGNRDEILTQKKTYYQAHREEILAKRKAYRQKKKEDKCSTLT